MGSEWQQAQQRQGSHPGPGKNQGGLVSIEPMELRGVHGLQGPKEVLVESPAACPHPEGVGGQSEGGGWGRDGEEWGIGCGSLCHAYGSPVGGVWRVGRATGLQARVGDICTIPEGQGRLWVVFGLGHLAVPRECMAVHSVLADRVCPCSQRLKMTAQLAFFIYFRF